MKQILFDNPFIILGLQKIRNNKNRSCGIFSFILKEWNNSVYGIRIRYGSRLVTFCRAQIETMQSKVIFSLEDISKINSKKS
jgi:hypothetical protein